MRAKVLAAGELGRWRSAAILVAAAAPLLAAAGASPRGTASPRTPAVTPIVIAVDAGHGGSADNSNPAALWDPGALTRSGLMEKDFTLDVARRVRALLQADLVKVIMTRDSDVFIDISPRMEIANQAGAELFVSIHFNSYTDPAVGGSLVVYQRPTSLPFAINMTKAMGARLQGYGVLSHEPVLNDGLWIHATMPAITIEPAYLSNDREAGLVNTSAFRDSIAAATRDGIYLQEPDIPARKAQILAARVVGPAARASAKPAAAGLSGSTSVLPLLGLVGLIGVGLLAFWKGRQTVPPRPRRRRRWR